MSKDYSMSKMNVMELMDSIIGKDVLFLPSGISEKADICLETKVVFAIVFDECVRKINYQSDNMLQAAEHIVGYMNSIDTSSVLSYIICSEKKAEQVKKELKTIAFANEIAAWLKECEMTFISQTGNINSFFISDYAIDIDRLIKSFKPRDRAKFVFGIYELSDKINGTNDYDKYEQIINHLESLPEDMRERAIADIMEFLKKNYPLN